MARIGIVGSGGAGLTSAWLLQDQHEVTLFEKDDRLGGHAHTVEVEAHGQKIPVNAGFEFFSAGKAYTTFNRLLDALAVPREPYPATMTVYYKQNQKTVVLPPFRGCLPIPASFTPEALMTLGRLRSFLTKAAAFLEQHNTTLTIADYIDQQNLPKSFVDDFLYPVLLSFWGVEVADFKRFAAYNALYYLGMNATSGLQSPVQSQIPGGLKTYVDALVATLDRTTIRQGAAVTKVTLNGDVYEVEDSAGGRHTFDHLVLASNANQALKLLEPNAALEPICDQLRRFEYFETTIAVHGDRRLMPHTESAWSVVNVRWDGVHSAISVWNPLRGLPVFRSWVTYDKTMPESLYALVKYQHGKITVDYFDAQKNLKPLQGHRNLWLAGLYTYDADSHESAIRSAVVIAERLAPGSARLKLLKG